jgi:importin subunit alpha-1
MRGKPLVKLSREQTIGVLEVVRLLIAHPSEEVVENMNWTLSYMSDNADGERTALFVDQGIAPMLVPYLTHYSKAVKMAALRTIGNIASGDERATQAVIDAHVLPVLRSLLVSQYQSVRKEAVWTISNICAGTVVQIAAVLQAELIAPMVQMLNKEPFIVQKEVTWAFCNLVLGGTSAQTAHLMQHGAVGPMCQMLQCPESDLLVTLLDAMSGMLAVGVEYANQQTGANPVEAAIDEGEGLRLLERLSSHENSDVYHRAEEILKHYFAEEEEGEVEDATVDAGEDLQPGAAATAAAVAAETSGFSFAPMPGAFRF